MSTMRSSLEIDDDKSKKQQKELDLWGWEDAPESHNARVKSASVTPSDFHAPTASMRVISKEQNILAKHLLTDSLHEHQAFRGLVQGQEVLQVMIFNTCYVFSCSKLCDDIDDMQSRGHPA